MASPMTQILDVWRRLPPGKRLVVVCAALATAALIAGLFYYGSQPDYAVLFSDLKPADAQSIVEKLKAAQIPYKVGGGGATIYAPTEQVTELRLQMASSGALSSRHVGFDIFDKSTFGATDFTQQVNYQRALEGELARTLESMSEVECARVHITKSRDSVFIDKAEPAKASVMLTMKGRELSEERTEAVVSLVASAVEGLDADNVSVMDSQGRMMTGKRGKKGLGGASDYGDTMTARRKFESDTAAGIVSLLEPVVGTGHVRANVTADIDFSQVDQTEETYDPKSSVVRAQQTTQEAKNALPATGGAAGTRANDPGTAAPVQVQTGNNQSGATRSASSVTYEISKVTKRIVGSGGKLAKMSVSVLIDSPKDKEGQPADMQKKVQELVAAAVGLDPARGDRVMVEMMQFQQAPVETPVTLPWVERNKDLVRSAIKYGVLFLVAILVMLMVIRPARRALRSAVEAPQQLLLEPSNEQFALPAHTDQHEHDFGRPDTNGQMESGDSAPLPELQPAPGGVTREQLVRYTKEDPSKVAMAVRNWLLEE